MSSYWVYHNLYDKLAAYTEALMLGSEQPLCCSLDSSCSFDGNAAAGSGGAAYLEFSSATFSGQDMAEAMTLRGGVDKELSNFGMCTQGVDVYRQHRRYIPGRAQLPWQVNYVVSKWASTLSSSTRWRRTYRWPHTIR
jgi:hypothetical protein